MEILDKTEAIIKESSDMIIKKFNLKNIEELSNETMKKYYNSLIESLNDLELDPVESMNNLETIIKDIDEQIQKEYDSPNPNLKEIEELKKLRDNINSQINRVR